MLWTDNPFSVYSRAEKVWVDGAMLFDRNDAGTKDRLRGFAASTAQAGEVR